MAASGNPPPQHLPSSPSGEEDSTEEETSESSEPESSSESEGPHFQLVRSLDKPPVSSSSSSTSEEGEEEEEKDSESPDSEPSLKEDGPRPPPSKSSVEALPPPPPRQSELAAPHSSDEEEEEEEEEESESPDSEPSLKDDGPRPPPSKSSDEALRPPPPRQSKLPAPHSSDEEESESSESESSSEQDGPSSQTSKSSLPTLNTGRFSSSSDEEDPETSSPSSDAHLAQREPLPPSPDTSQSKPWIQKPWTKEDEITLLQKLLEYKSQCGKLPSLREEVVGFHKSVQHLFSANISTKQLVHKMVNLRKRFNRYNKKLKSGGKAPVVGQDHLLLVLLGKLWEKTEDGLGEEVTETRNAKRMKTSEEELEDVTPNAYKFLTMLVEHMDHKLIAAGKLPWLKDHLLLLDTKTLADLEMKCFTYFVNESKVSASRHDFHLRLIEAIQEEDGIISQPSTSYFHSRF